MRPEVRRGWAVLGPLAWGIGLLGAARIPWACAWLPAVGVLKGPLGVALLLLAAAVSAACALRGRRLPDLPSAALWGVSGAVLVTMGLFYTSRLRVSGDEPHYLLMAQSLWQERDLDLRDNYAREDFLEYTPGPIAPHYGAPRADGRPFPTHSPGLPLLLAPVYALAGRPGCVVLLALMAAALGVQVYALAWRLSGQPAALLAGAAAVSPPVAFYAFHIYTEVPSALALALSLRLLTGSPGPVLSALAALLAFALPWLHVKMIPAALTLGAFGLLRLRGRALATFLIVSGVMAAVYLGYLQAIFGRATPLAAYGGVPRDVSATPLRAALGLLLDRSFGLLPHAPLFLLSLAGLPLLARRGGREVLPHALLAAAVVAPVLTWRMWWGGQCPPGRFLVPLVPFLGVALAVRMAGSPCGLARWRWVLLAMGAALALFMTARPAELLLLNRGDRPTRVWAALSGEWSVGRYLPSLTAMDGAERRVVILWVAAVTVLLLLDYAARQREAVDRLFRGLGLPLLLLLAIGVGVDYWARTGSSASSASPSSPDSAISAAVNSTTAAASASDPA